MRMIKDNVERIADTKEKAARLKGMGFHPMESTMPAGDLPEELVNKPLEEMTAAELKAVAESKGLSGYSSLSKSELLEILKDVV